MDSLAEVRKALNEVREYVAETEFDKAHAEKLQYYCENVDIICNYLADKLPILVNVNTKDEDRLHITVVVNLYFEGAIHDGEDLEKLEQKSASSGASISRLQRLLKRATRTYWRLVSGLLTPKEWTLKGEMAIGPLGKAGVEIKFGK